MANKKILEQALKITKKLSSSNRILILASKPVDMDCLGTALATKWWIKKALKKDSEIKILYSIPERIAGFIDIDQIEEATLLSIEWESYDTIVLVDGSDWHLFLTSKYEEVLTRVGKDKFINIDHHFEGHLERDLKENSVRVKDCCTSKILYDYFIKPSNVKVDAKAATYMYLALIGDTGRYTWEIYSDTLSFGQELINLGADHNMAVDENTTLESIKFLEWAIKNTDYVPEIETTILCIDSEKSKELGEIFGSSWRMKSIHKYYIEVVMRRIVGYNYGVMFDSSEKANTITGGWRTRNYGQRISMLSVFETLGFEAGGHFGAGGGNYSGEKNIKEIKTEFINVMKSELEKLGK